MTNTIYTAEEALAAFLEISPDEVSEENYRQYGAPVYCAESNEYLVLTDNEADQVCAEYIKDSLWAFNASFLTSETGIPQEMFEAVQDRCEGANDAFLAIVEKTCGLDSFVESAISADGRGHFLAGYDGNENESGNWFIYRIN